MKILTFQHKKVWDTIQKEGIYLANIESEYKKNTPKCYDLVLNAIKEKSKNAKQPIFGWYAVLDVDNSKLTVNDKTISRCLEMTSPGDADDYVLLELEVNPNEVSLQDFYNFVDARCEEEGIDCYYGSFEQFPFHVVFELSEGEVQATLASVKLEDVLNVYTYKANSCTHINDYSLTGQPYSKEKTA